MRKLYDGYASPAPDRVRYYLDWSCPSCGSSNVEVDPNDRRKLSWCDGGPSTEDHMRYWICTDCRKQTLGYDMDTTRENFDFTPEEIEQQRIDEKIALSQLKQLFDTLESKSSKL